MKRSAGFTLVELVMVIIILGILAVMVMPRMSTSDYRGLEFHDRVVSALRYAQKTATSHRRMVCVAFTTSTVTLTIARANPSVACDDPLVLPGGNSNSVQSSDATNVVFSAVPVAFSFQPDGSGANRSLGISGQTVINVVGVTGHVQ